MSLAALVQYELNHVFRQDESFFLGILNQFRANEVFFKPKNFAL
jgi:hypothetical protein